ncbi:MAG: DeoR/GlpR family DNA-binding transcription regulator [Luteolibacter sp.]
MIAAERHLRILELARREGSVRTTELARDYDVTEETIRRDLDLLTRQGKLRRIHGGAMDVSSAREELPQNERRTRQLTEKTAIAKTAATLLSPSETILLDASSTAIEFAAQLPIGMPLRVVTYSLDVVDQLIHQPHIEIIQLGGSYEARGRRFSGFITEASLSAIRIDRFFYSGGGFDLERGLSEPNQEQARLKRLMIHHAAWNCVLIDHTKLGAQADFFAATPEQIHAVVSDAAAAEYFNDLSTSYDLHFAP